MKINKMEIVKVKKGQIVQGTHRKFNEAYHPVVYLEGNLDEDFLGVMLTTNGEYTDNVAMKEEHFTKLDNKGNPYPIQFKETYFVKVQLKKRTEWGPYNITGQLTESGIEYIQSKISALSPIYWDEYMSNKAN
ncbi:MAG TPA: hypothetical protein VF411_00730 [Bacteroidia bacterium]